MTAIQPSTFDRGGWRPPVPYTAESERGNLKALRHGARSIRVIEPIASAYIANIVEAAPLLADLSFRPALERWAFAEARCVLYERWLAQHEDLESEDFDPETTGWCRDQLLRWHRRASHEAQQLGLTPMSRAQLERAVAAARATNATWQEIVRRNNKEAR